ncbi:MAG: hypothetical protein IJU57_02165 [Clostridia bacterium]|nr:hypothetical protein [Clostridia bacterium]
MNRKVYVLIVISAVFCILVASLAVGGADYIENLEIRTYAESGLSGYEADVFLPGSENGIAMFSMSEENVVLDGVPSELKTRTINGIESIWCVVTGDPEPARDYDMISITLDLKEDKIKLNDINTLVFGVAVIGKANNCSGYLSETRLVTSDGEYTSETVIEKPGSTKRFSLIRADLSEVSGYAEKLEFILYFESGFPPVQVRLTRPFVTEDPDPGFEYSENYAVDSLKYITETFNDADPVTGELIMFRERRACDAAEISGVGRSDILLGGRIVASEVAARGSRMYIAVSLWDIRKASMYVGLTYADDRVDEIRWEKPIAVSGNGTFLIPVEISGRVMDLYLKFTNAEYERSFSVDSIKTMFIDSANPVHDEMGHIKSVTLDGRSVKFAGSVNRDYMKDLSEGELVFYAVTGSLQHFPVYTEIGRMSLSTRFEYTCDISGLNLNLDLTEYACAIEYMDLIYEICPPRFPEALSGKDIHGPTKTGLHGAASAGIFASNVSHVMIDVPLDELIAGSSSSEKTMPLTYYSYSGGKAVSRTALLSRELVSRLDNDAGFYLSADMKVYFRLTLNEPAQGLGKDAEGGACVDLGDPEGVDLYSALIGFIAGRYQKAEALVIDTSVRAFRLGAESLPEEMQCRAELARITYNAIVSKNRDAVIAVDLPEDLKMTGVIFAQELKSIGEIPWYLMTSVDDSDEYLEKIRDLMDNLTRLELYKPGLMCLYTPSAEDYSSVLRSESEVFKEYGSLLDRLVDEKAIFLSADGLGALNGKEFYSDFRITSGLGDFISELEAEESEDGAWTGTCRIWDFSDKYHTMGWIAGGGTGLVTTDYTVLNDHRAGSDRVLRTEIKANRAGVLIRDFSREIDLSGCDVIEFEFAVIPDEASGGGETTVQFFTGSDDYRAEYSVRDLPYGERITAVCDLDEYGHTGEISYVGVQVYSGVDVSLELFSVTARSSSVDSVRLGEMFGGMNPASVQTDAESHRLGLIVIIAAVALGVLTVTLVVLAVRHDREEKEKQQKSGSKENSDRERRKKQYIR